MLLSRHRKSDRNYERTYRRQIQIAQARAAESMRRYAREGRNARRVSHIRQANQLKPTCIGR